MSGFPNERRRMQGESVVNHNKRAQVERSDRQRYPNHGQKPPQAHEVQEWLKLKR